MHARIITRNNKKTERTPILFLFVMLMFNQPAFSQITLNTCQEKAKANYPLIRQYDLIAKSTEYNLSNAGKAYLPQLSLTGIGAYIFNGLPTINLPGTKPAESDNLKLIGIGQVNQTIWDGGATHSQKEILKSAGEVDRAQVDVAMHQIRERVNQVYFGILLIDEQLKQSDILKEMLDRNLNKMLLAKRNGMAYQTDVDELKTELLNLDEKQINFQFARKGYIEMLSYLTGQELGDHVQLEVPQPTGRDTTMNRPELLLYSQQRSMAGAQYSMSKVNNMPKVGLLGAGVFITPGTQFGTSTLSSLSLAGLSVSWNTAGVYRSSNNKELQKIQLAKINIQEEAFRFNTTLELKQVANQLASEKAILAKDNEIVALRNKIREAYELKYASGISPMNDLLNAVNKESEARSNNAIHQMQLLMTYYRYQSINGN